MTGLAAQAALVLALGRPAAGWAVRYAPNVMEHTAAVRGVAPVGCMVAWTRATDRDIGETWLVIRGPAGTLRCLVIDLPRPGKDKANLLRRRVAVELDYESGFRICGKGWRGAAVECPVLIWR